jgi:hypothetical protein
MTNMALVLLIHGQSEEMPDYMSKLTYTGLVQRITTIDSQSERLVFTVATDFERNRSRDS